MSDFPIPVFEDARSVTLLLPLSPQSAVGGDVRGLPVFDEIEADVRLIETEGPAAVPWARVAQLGLELLTNQGRDLLVAAWTTLALTQTEQWRGLAVGLDALAPMVRDWWDIIPPKRERARVGALEWMVSRLVPVVSALPTRLDDAAAILHAGDLLEELNTLLPQRLIKEQIAFGDLTRAVRPKVADVRDLLAQAEQAAAEAEEKARQAEAAAAAQAERTATQEAAPAPSAPPAAGHSPTAPASTEPSPASPAAPPPPAPPMVPNATGPELDRAIGGLADSMRQHARQLRETNLADPRSYRLTRAAAWLDINLPPPANAGATQLMAPSSERLEGIAAMGRVGEHEALVRTLEGMIGSSPFWLDANRLAFEALAALGGKHALAAEAVVEMSCAFARRLPTLVELTFADGTPFASPATRAWLEQQSGPATGDATGSTSDELAGLANEIRELIGAGRKSDALDRLDDARRALSSGRALFELQLLQAQTCLDLDIPAVALPLLRHLEAEVEHRALEAWEPGLALRSARLALRAYRHPAAEKVLGAPDLRGAVEAAQRRLARLDLRTAVRLAHA
ncbi:MULTISPECIES: type VI secretion system protein TssA [unclassified Xanthobacter]|uniref:type VI secretion system protein TssA n=1 Tax=unclassified Xanthobacter TaxID=2623496 RepID=UPI001F259285|nr:MULTISPECIES: type VI secretion system protein TssA [unclassified Xanthobacter]